MTDSTTNLILGAYRMASPKSRRPLLSTGSRASSFRPSSVTPALTSTTVSPSAPVSASASASAFASGSSASASVSASVSQSSPPIPIAPNSSSLASPPTEITPLVNCTSSAVFTPTAAPCAYKMASSTFLPHPHHFRPAGQNLQMTSMHGVYLDHDAVPRHVSTPFAPVPPFSTSASVLIRRLPLNTSEESLRLMVVWSTELAQVELLPIEQSEDLGFRSAILIFKTYVGAQAAKNMLDGRSNISNDAEMIVEILPSTPLSARGFYNAERSSAASGLSSSSSNSSTSAVALATSPSMRQLSRFNAPFQSLNQISTPPSTIFSAKELPNPDSDSHYQDLFSPQSPIGNHLADRTRMSGKALIKNDAVDDDETGELLKDPLAYAENGHSATTIQRRATAPQVPITARMLSLSMHDVAPIGASSLPHYLTPSSARTSAVSSTSAQLLNGIGSNGIGYSISAGAATSHFARQNFPPVNPADQNPPCNTLYVGNLPIDTSEEELKAIFSKQRGYKRLCFRTKQNGPMCFVEFEDVTFATKALHELYGSMLHNSVKGGIRLSFSKNPLGVRSGQPTGQPGASSITAVNGVMSSSAGLFATASGPPPGLSAPPGFGVTGMMYGAGFSQSATPSGGHLYAVAGFPSMSSVSNIWNPPAYNTAVTSGTPLASMINGSPPTYLPPHMMGR